MLMELQVRNEKHRECGDCGDMQSALEGLGRREGFLFSLL